MRRRSLKKWKEKGNSLDLRYPLPRWSHPLLNNLCTLPDNSSNFPNHPGTPHRLKRAHWRSATSAPSPTISRRSQIPPRGHDAVQSQNPAFQHHPSKNVGPPNRSPTWMRSFASTRNMASTHLTRFWWHLTRIYGAWISATTTALRKTHVRWTTMRISESGRDVAWHWDMFGKGGICFNLAIDCLCHFIWTLYVVWMSILGFVLVRLTLLLISFYWCL
jgi:hypothetical protein